jgi:hypothetical protein
MNIDFEFLFDVKNNSMKVNISISEESKFDYKSQLKVLKFINGAKNKGKLHKLKKKTANEFVNIKRIDNDLLYTIDGYIFAYLKVASISTELMSDSESKSFINNITAQLSSENKPFQFFIITQPADISEMTSLLGKLKNESKNNRIKESLIYNEINEITNFAIQGDVSTRQFYLIIWEKLSDDNEILLKKRAKNLSNKLSSCGVFSEVLQNQGIYLFSSLK